MFTEAGPTLPEESVLEQETSRYGNKEEIITAFHETDLDHIHTYGSIKEALSSYTEQYGNLIPDHTNRVELIDILTGNGLNLNKVIPLDIETTKNEHILAIFKPINGEAGRKEDSRISSFAPNEEIAYRISEHFGLDLVPPTTLRNLGEGNRGSIQLFLNPFEHGLYAHVFPEMSRDEQMRANPDYQAMAILDYLLLNADRNTANFFVEAQLAGKINRDGSDEPRYETSKSAAELKLFAIDHGLSFSTEDFIKQHFRGLQAKKGGIPGPLRAMTAETQVTDWALNVQPTAEVKPLRQQFAIPELLSSKLQGGLDNFADLGDKIEQVLSLSRETETKEGAELVARRIELLKRRTQQLLNAGHFLSPHNSQIERE